MATIDIPEATFTKAKHAATLDGVDPGAWIVSKITERLDCIEEKGLPKEPERVKGGGKQHSVKIPGPIMDRLEFEADETPFTKSRLALACLLEMMPSSAPVTVTRELPRYDDASPPSSTSTTTPTPKKSREVIAWEKATGERVRLAEYDIAAGRWGHYTIVGGEAGVNRYGPLGPDGLVDFEPALYDRKAVVKEIIPWCYSAEEQEAWRRARNAEGRALAWTYISAQSESWWNAQEDRRRAGIRARNPHPDILEGLRMQEREEELGREIWGHTVHYIEWANKDIARLLAIGERDGIPAERVTPPNMARLVSRALAVGWQPPRGQVLALPGPVLERIAVQHGRPLLLS